MARTAPLLKYGDLEKFPEDGPRRELIGGELFVSPSPVPSHQDVVSALVVAFRTHARRHGGRAFVGPTDVLFGPHDVVAPDLVYLAQDRLHLIGEKNISGAPSLVVEVLSPSTHRIDRGKKRALYARQYVPEYWIVDIAARSIERCTEPKSGEYRTIEIVEGDDAIVASRTIADLSIPLTELFS